MKKILLSLMVVGVLLFGCLSSFTQGQKQCSLDVEAASSVVTLGDYVIITLPELESSVASLKTWKQYLGYPVEVVTISWITSHYQGIDIQEQIRNFLIEKYSVSSLAYVLFVGSIRSIPLRICYPLPSEFTDHVSTDYYYADLTGDWDADHDGFYGEYSDDTVDFIPEVSVGRIPCDDPVLVRQICQNIIRYEQDTGTWKNNVLSLASIIYYENMTAFNWTYARSDGATLMEKCKSDILEPHGYLTVRMYEKEGIRPSTYTCEYPISHKNVLTEWIKGYGLVNMLGHASEYVTTQFIWDHDDGDNIPEQTEGELQYVDFLRSTDSAKLQMKTPPIVVSAGCSQLGGSKNIGQSFLEDGAAVAFVGTTDLSYYNITRVWRDERDGGAFSLDYYFVSYLIGLHQKCGDALNNAKVTFLNHFMFTSYDPEWIKRCYSTLLGYSLYGDPALGLTVNKTDTTPPILTLEQPNKYLYIKGSPILPSQHVSVILGSIAVKASAVDNETGVATMELWIDGVLKNTTDANRLEWFWDETSILQKHTLKIIAIDTVGNRVEQEHVVLMFNI
jgi:Phr family secreted Rap phosphatase inhibitor